MKDGNIPQTTYAGITRIRFEGLGRRYAPISAGLRQRPLDCGTIVARRVEDVKWLLGNGEINSAYERTIIIEVGKREKKALTNGTGYGSLTKLSGRAERV